MAWRIFGTFVPKGEARSPLFRSKQIMDDLLPYSLVWVFPVYRDRLYGITSDGACQIFKPTNIIKIFTNQLKIAE